MQFSRGLEELFRDLSRLYLEVGPRSGVDVADASARCAPKNSRVFASTRHPQEQGSDCMHLLSTAGQLSDRWVPDQMGRVAQARNRQPHSAPYLPVRTPTILDRARRYSLRRRKTIDLTSSETLKAAPGWYYHPCGSASSHKTLLIASIQLANLPRRTGIRSSTLSPTQNGGPSGGGSFGRRLSTTAGPIEVRRLPWHAQRLRSTLRRYQQI